MSDGFELAAQLTIHDSAGEAPCRLGNGRGNLAPQGSWNGPHSLATRSRSRRSNAKSAHVRSPVEVPVRPHCPGIIGGNDGHAGGRSHRLHYRPMFGEGTRVHTEPFQWMISARLSTKSMLSRGPTAHTSFPGIPSTSSRTPARLLTFGLAATRNWESSHRAVSERLSREPTAQISSAETAAWSCQGIGWAPYQHLASKRHPMKGDLRRQRLSAGS
jgi:hypothetical protein